VFRRNWILAALGVVVLVAAVVVALHANSSSPSNDQTAGVTSNQIILGSHQPLTGPAAPGYKQVSAAANAFFRYINAHGGVYGRSIVFDYQDDSYNPVNTLHATQRLLNQDKVFAMDAGLGTSPHQAVVGYLNSKQVPDLFVESGCTCFNDPINYPYTFGYFPDYKIEGKILGQYVRTNFPTDKVAYLLQDDDLGQNSQEGLNQIIPNTSVVTQQSYDANYLSGGLGQQVAAAKAAKATVVVVFGIPAAVALALLAAAQLQYHPTFIVGNVGADPQTLGGLITQYSQGAANVSLANGVITDSYVPPPNATANPWIQLFRNVHDNFDASEPFNFYTVSGMAMAYATYQSLHAAGQNLTRQSLVNALITQGSTFHGPNLAPYGFSATDHNGMRGAEMGTLANGDVIMAGPVFVTDDRDAPVTAYFGPQPPPPTSF
jgi:ABC-type branched-subunit amino acid transport system substrate-binding protein